MAAVRKPRGGRAALVADKAAPTLPPPPVLDPALATRQRAATLPDAREVALAPGGFVSRGKLDALLEEDRRDHDRLHQRAKEKRHTDEADAALAVAMYILKLQERLADGVLG